MGNGAADLPTMAVMTRAQMIAWVAKHTTGFPTIPKMLNSLPHKNTHEECSDACKHATLAPQ